MTRPKRPAGLADTISDLLTIEAAARQAIKPSLRVRVARFLEPRVMPYTVGSFASLILSFLMFPAVRPIFVARLEAALRNSGGSVVIVTPYPPPQYDFYKP